MGLDNTLLTVAQTGMFIYSMFSIIGWYFTMEDGTPVGLIADIFAFVQTCLQVFFFCLHFCKWIIKINIFRQCLSWMLGGDGAEISPKLKPNQGEN